jgi:hypothetical protein
VNQDWEAVGKYRQINKLAWITIFSRNRNQKVKINNTLSHLDEVTMQQWSSGSVSQVGPTLFCYLLMMYGTSSIMQNLTNCVWMIYTVVMVPRRPDSTLAIYKSYQRSVTWQLPFAIDKFFLYNIANNHIGLILIILMVVPYC